MREFLADFAAQRGLQSKIDDAGNIVIYVPGRGTGVTAEPLAVQAHMDMVCVADKGVQHDFLKDPLQLRREIREIKGESKEVLAATGTTLGADNGIGIASTLALVTSPDVRNCPPLELLLTVDEERGLVGARKLDPSLLQSRRLLNLDSEARDTIYIGCAGARDQHLAWEVERSPVKSYEEAVRINVTGLPGGHSGVEIHDNRGNAISFLAWLLENSLEHFNSMRLVSLSGGEARNVIPGEAEAVIVVARGGAEWLKGLVAEEGHRAWAGEASRGHAPEALHKARIKVTELKTEELPFDPIIEEKSEQIIFGIRDIKIGPRAWSEVIEGMVETSNNLGVISTDEGEVRAQCLARSSKEIEIQKLQEEIAARLRWTGAKSSLGDPYPGWDPDPFSPLLIKAQGVFKSVLGREPEVTAIHAGLECGVLRSRLQGLQAISFGPELHEVHSPRECIVLETVRPFWLCLVNLAEELCSKPQTA